MSHKKPELLLLCSIIFTAPTYSESYFPTDMLDIKDGMADLSYLRADGSQPEGVYNVDVFINQVFVTNKKLQFLSTSKDGHVKYPPGENDGTGLSACVTSDLLRQNKVKIENYPGIQALDDKQCVSLGENIPGAYTFFDVQKLRLDIHIPQAAMRNVARGYIEPELWDNGINAALMNYSFSGSNGYAGKDHNKSYFLSLNGGLNVGPWRLRDYRTWNYYESPYGSHQQWQRIKTYVERPIVPLRSTLVMGENSTPGEIFDSLSYRGVALSTDDTMYPDTMRGYAPVVRGIAESNAEVSIRQNEYVIYRAFVSPGAFEISDLNLLSLSGDLEVTVKEANGDVRVFSVPYSSVPRLLREGRSKYALVAGRYVNNSIRYGMPAFAQGTLLHGLPHNLTVYGGFQFSENYLAKQFGGGVNMGSFGAIAADLTFADSTLVDGTSHQGKSMRFQFSHSVSATGTRLSLAGYRYSTKGFYTLDETALKSMRGRADEFNALDDDGYPQTGNYDNFYNLTKSKKARAEANVSQSLGKVGAVYLTGLHQTYWNSQDKRTSAQVGFSSSLGPMSYSINYGYSRNQGHSFSSYKEQNMSISFSVPLNKLLGLTANNPVYATSMASRNNNGSLTQQNGLNGVFFEDKSLGWNVSQGTSGNQGNVGNANLNYKGRYGNSNVGYAYSSNSQRVNYGISGGALLHEGGVTLGQPLGDTSVLIATKGEAGLHIKSEPGVTTDWRGYAIKPFASAYRENRIAIDTTSLADDIDVEGNVTRVVPTKGAITRADFDVRSGQRMLLTLIHQGRPVPFGTIITSDGSSSIVGDDGIVYLSGMPVSGSVQASWGEGKDKQCITNYNLTKIQHAPSIVRLTENCS